LMRFSFLLLLFPVSLVLADVSRFIDSIELPTGVKQTKVFINSSAFI
jgi:hypothetical protein